MSEPTGWAPLVGPPRQENETLRQTGYDTLTPTWGQSLEAHVGNWWQDSPLTALLRVREQNLARDPNLGAGPEEIHQTPPSRLLAADEWKNGPYARPGLSHFEGMNEDTAKLLAERHDERAKREDVVNRESGLQYGLMGTVGLLTTFADPINIASAFVPVVGEARYARMLAQLGAPLARVLRGAAEGAVGQALLEPLSYAADQQDQIDHSMVDSLVNIGMGAGFGAGLHSISGLIGDALGGHGGRAGAAAGDVAIRQAAAGQEVDVRPVVKAAIDEDAAQPKPPDLRQREPDAADLRPPAAEAPFLIKESEEPVNDGQGSVRKVYNLAAYKGGEDASILSSLDVKITGDEARIESIISMASPGDVKAARGTLGHRDLLRVAAAIAKDNPEVKFLTGERVTGIRVGGEHVAPGQGKEVRVPIEPLLNRGGKLDPAVVDRAGLKDHIAGLRRSVGETQASSISPTAAKLSADREKIRKGLAEDAARPPKPQTFDEQRKQAMVDLIDAYPSREITLPTGGKVTRKGPMDIVTWLRAMGGVQDAGGELRSIDAKSYNKSREVAFAKGEQFLGKLVRDDGQGLPLEEAARRAAEAGYIGRTQMETNEYGESGAYSHGTPEELVAAIEKTLGAGESIEGRVWGIDDDQPVQQYAETMRAIDQNELFEPQPQREQWQPLTDEDMAAQELAGFDPRDLEGIDNENLADELWKEEMDREAAAKAQPPEDPQAPAAPVPEGQPKPLTPEQEVELDAERYRTGIAAAAACMARTL